MSGAFLARVFAQHVEAREFSELSHHQDQIAAAIQLDDERRPTLAIAPADPRFFAAHGGLYWQIDTSDGGRQRSRSLWESELSLPADNIKDGAPHRHTIKGPGHQTLLALERALTIGSDSAPLPLRLTVAVDRRDLDKAIADFRKVLAISLGVLGAALLLALIVQVEVGLRPLARLRSALQRVHGGAAEQVEGTFPSEIHPLITDMNALLERERHNNTLARDRAADLAHGFKTPLSVLSAISRDLVRDGRPAAAAEIDAQIDLMGRHVRRELARARTIGASPVRQTPVAVRPVLNKIVAALGRIASER